MDCRKRFLKNAYWAVIDIYAAAITNVSLPDSLRDYIIVVISKPRIPSVINFYVLLADFSARCGRKAFG